MRQTTSLKRPKDLRPEEKLKAVLKAALLSENQFGAFPRSKGLHKTYLQQWRLEMLNALGKVTADKKPKRSALQVV